MFETTRRRTLQALGIGSATAVAGCQTAEQRETTTKRQADKEASKQKPVADRVAADPTDVPDPVDWSTPKTHEVELEVKEVRAQVEDGVTFDYMTFDGQIPGPMIRVRRGDTVRLTLSNPKGNGMPHNVDFHAVYGTGGGAEATTVQPGESSTIEFKAMYPGAFIYHCAVPNLDYHISSGMFGMIVVEPKDGLPAVDREFFVGQHELYTDKKPGQEGHHKFDFESMKAEEPTYVLLNGEKYAFTPDNRGPLKAKKGEKLRVFFVQGGPNLSSNFHPIGNVWSEAYRDGALKSQPERFVQTMKVPPGSCMVGTLDTPVPETIKLVDHALSRVARRGMLGLIQVEGSAEPDIFDPEPGTK